MSSQTKESEEMIIHLFEVSGKELVPTRHCLALKFLKDIMDNYDNHIDIYKYVYYMTCPDPVNNPYFNMNEVIRETKIIRDNDMHFNTEDDLIQTAITKCTELYRTPTIKAHDTIKGMVENLMEYMATEKIRTGNKNNVSSFISLSKEFDNLKEKYLSTTKELHAEQKAHGKKGGGMLAYDLREGNSRDDD